MRKKLVWFMRKGYTVSVWKVLTFYMKYSVNAGSISSVVKIVNFVGGAKSE